MYMMSAAWASLAVVLSALGALWTWVSWKRQGPRGLVRGLAITILPLALWLTGTLRLAGAILDWVTSWASGLIFSPSVWVGTALFVLSALLWAASARMRPRAGEGRAARRATQGATGPAPAVGSRTARRGAPAVQDDDMADIEALLRQRGIG